MAFSLIQEGSQSNIPTRTYICDSDEDVAMLPTDIQPGSTAIVVGTSLIVYVLNNAKQWKKVV